MRAHVHPREGHELHMLMRWSKSREALALTVPSARYVNPRKKLPCSRCRKSYPATRKYFGYRASNIKQLDSWCLECKRKSRRNWGSRNSATLKKTQAARRLSAKIEAMAAYSKGSKPSCACCGETHIEFLNIDHQKGGGTKHRTSLGHSGRGNSFYRWLKKNGYPDGYRVLCANCNQAFGLFGKCPHQGADQ